MLGLYIHIPFCRTKCPYCDFVSEPIRGEVPDVFVDALCSEIGAFEGPGEADSIFFGGGTPSLLSPTSLGRILDAIGRRFTLTEPEITVEANPDDVTPELLDAWKRLGVNRVSLGVQSFNDEVLRYLGRRHDAEAARRACAWTAERFENWSMDLIFGARPVDTWGQTLRECAGLTPPHVSAYGLTYEPSTRFGARADDAVDDETYLRLYWLVDEMLSGLGRYEVSNLARPGFECRHNLRYWHNEEYAGFGPGAYSFVDGVRARNTAALAEYVVRLSSGGTSCWPAGATGTYAAPSGACDGEEARFSPTAHAVGYRMSPLTRLVKVESLALSEGEIRTETVIQHLRLRTGLPKGYYQERFGQSVREDFGVQLDTLRLRGLVEETDDVVRPTIPRGFELNNEIGLALVD